MVARRSPKTTFGLIAIILVLTVALLLVLVTNWNPFWIWLAAINPVTFFIYGYDKNEAKRGGLRVPEIVLHGLALAGGFLGGWAGMFFFHHKTRKPTFIVVLALSTVIWIVIVYWLLFRL